MAREAGQGRRPRPRRIGPAAGLFALQALACGSPPVCPNGDCSTPGTTVAMWRFDHYPAWGFDSDSCTDLGIAKVHIDATDASGAVTSQDVPCDYGQATFTGLAQGGYTIAITPLDGDGNAVVAAPITGMVTAPPRNGTASTTIDVPYTAWTGSYTGTFLFRISWGGASCAAAMPPVATQLLTLAVNGTVVAQTTDGGQRLDGTDAKACVAFTNQFPESATTVPFGPAQLTVVGEDTGGAAVFQHTFDTFVGAGISNPTLGFDLTHAAADAGVDATPPADGAPATDATPADGP